MSDNRDDPTLSPAVRVLAEARGLTRACELFPADVARAATRAARPLANPERPSSTEPALRLDASLFDPRRHEFPG